MEFFLQRKAVWCDALKETIEGSLGVDWVKESSLIRHFCVKKVRGAY